jgi:hypothetical protein
MAIVHDIPTRNLIVDTVCGSNLDGGSILYFLDNTNVVMATIGLDTDAFVPSVNGSATANGFPKSGTVVFAGTVAWFQILNPLLVTKITGTVTIAGGGGDIELSSLVYSVGEIINLSSLTYRVPN